MSDPCTHELCLYQLIITSDDKLQIRGKRFYCFLIVRDTEERQDTSWNMKTSLKIHK